MSTSKLDLAREWARKYQRHHVIGSENELAAVEVIQSLPDQWIDAEKLREVVSKYEGNTFIAEIVKEFADLLPTPAPRTLADMPLGELQDYIGGEVIVDGWANPAMLVAVIGDEGGVLAHRWNVEWPFVDVLPLTNFTPVPAPEQESEETP